MDVRKSSPALKPYYIPYFIGDLLLIFALVAAADEEPDEEQEEKQQQEGADHRSSYDTRLVGS